MKHGKTSLKRADGNGELKKVWVLLHDGEPVGTFPWIGNAQGYVKVAEDGPVEWLKISPHERQFTTFETVDGSWSVIRVPWMPWIDRPHGVLVGETGPEVVHFHEGGTVVSFEDLRNKLEDPENDGTAA